MESGAHWYVVQTHPHNEGRADEYRCCQGFATYLPRHLRRRHVCKSEIIARPLFPRYLFVALDLAHDCWRSVQSTFRLSNLALAGETPAPLPELVIEEIRARKDAAGYVTLGLPAGLKPGSPVRLIEGLFADYRIADDRRVAVFLSLLGRQVRVFVPAASIGVT